MKKLLSEKTLSNLFIPTNRIYQIHVDNEPYISDGTIAIAQYCFNKIDYSPHNLLIHVANGESPIKMNIGIGSSSIYVVDNGAFAISGRYEKLINNADRLSIETPKSPLFLFHGGSSHPFALVMPMKISDSIQGELVSVLNKITKGASLIKVNLR